MGNEGYCNGYVLEDYPSGKEGVNAVSRRHQNRTVLSIYEGTAVA